MLAVIYFITFRRKYRGKNARFAYILSEYNNFLGYDRFPLFLYWSLDGLRRFYRQPCATSIRSVYLYVCIMRWSVCIDSSNLKRLELIKRIGGVRIRIHEYALRLLENLLRECWNFISNNNNCSLFLFSKYNKTFCIKFSFNVNNVASFNI